MPEIKPVRSVYEWLELVETLLNTYSNNKLVRSSITERLTSRGFGYNDAARIIDGHVSPKSLSDIERCVFGKAVYDAIADNVDKRVASKIALEKFFPPGIVISEHAYRHKQEEAPSYPITMSNVLLINEYEYTWLTTWEEVVKLFRAGLIEYDAKAQRELKLASGESYRIQVYPDKIQQIEQMMLSGDVYDYPITLNIEEQSVAAFEHPRNSLILGRYIINTGRIIIPDGFHRLLAATQAVSKNPEFGKTVITVMLKNLSDGKIKQHIANINRQVPMERLHANEMSTASVANQIVEALITENNSLVRGKITKASKKFWIEAFSDFLTFDKASDTQRYIDVKRKTIEFYNKLAEESVITEKPTTQEIFAMAHFLALYLRDESLESLVLKLKSVGWDKVNAIPITKGITSAIRLRREINRLVGG